MAKHLFIVRVHYNGGTVDFNAINRGDAAQEAERIMRDGVWATEHRLLPREVITFIEVLEKETKI